VASQDPEILGWRGMADQVTEILERIDMDLELQKYYESRFDMFAHPAWKDLMEDVQNMMDATNTLSGVTPENVGFKQGEVSIMRWILTLQKTTEESYKDLTNADTE